MKNQKIKVKLPAWSESKKAWYFLTKSNKDKTAWSNGKWFPKKWCQLKVSKKNKNIGKLKIPNWLYQEMFKK